MDKFKRRKYMIKNLALWGYGYHGKDVESAILGSHSDKFRITAIFDARFEELDPITPGHEILDPARILEYYQEGLFDAVMITVYDKDQKARIAIRLDDMGIPVEDNDEALSNDHLFRDADCFPQGQVDFSWQEREGYSFNVLRDMRMAFFRNSDFVFIFDRDGYILSSGWLSDHFRGEPYLKMYTPPKTEETIYMPGEWCFLGKIWTANYWHFTYECMDQMWLLEKSGYTGRYILAKRKFSQELTALLGVDPERISWREDFDHEAVYQFETLVCTELLHNDRRRSAPVLLEMAGDILSRIQTGERRYPRRIFVKRIGSRRLMLDKRSESLLEDLGFETIVPEELPVTEQIVYFHNADIVLSPHGANSTNSLYMRPGTVFIETFPYNFVNPSCLETSYCGKLHYLQVIEPHGAAGGSRDPYRDYSIYPHLLELVIRDAIQLAE